MGVVMRESVRLGQGSCSERRDKDDISCVSVWVYDPRDYDDVKASLTAQRLKALHPKLWRGEIERYELPVECNLKLTPLKE